MSLSFIRQRPLRCTQACLRQEGEEANVHAGQGLIVHLSTFLLASSTLLKGWDGGNTQKHAGLHLTLLGRPRRGGGAQQR